MSKIERFNGTLKAFASDAIAGERTLFGATTSGDDLTSQINDDFKRGWGIVGVNDAPTKQDFNALGYTATQLAAYLHQMGVPEWNASQQYQMHSFVNYEGSLFACRTNNLTSSTIPPDDADNWNPAGSGTPITAYDADFLVVAGGGGGGGPFGSPDPQPGGGGGGGGMVTGTFNLTAGVSYSIVVGAGGTGGTSNATQGGNSSAFETECIGGGKGGGGEASSGQAGGAGGSGGGGGYANKVGGAGTAGQGNKGGNSTLNTGGGGGKGSAGGAPTAGTGAVNSLSGTSTTYAAGGIGVNQGASVTSVAGSANTGNGGSGGFPNAGGSGGSGIVIISYPSPAKGTGGTITTVGANTVHTFTASGTYTA